MDAPTINNQFCAAIDRDPTIGFITGFRSGYVNLAAVETSGIDVIDAISQVECQTPDSNDGVCQDNTSSKSVHPVTIDSAILIDESGSSWWPF